MRFTRRSLALLLGIGLVLGVAGALAVQFATRLSYTVPPAPDYADESAWICRPGRADVCAKPTTATIVDPEGGTRVATYQPDPAAPIDCFYVYPTVSRLRAAYAPIALGDEEVSVARRQLARFSSVCRPFAPLYRQVTLRALRDLFAGRHGLTIDVPYADVRAAWKTYLAKDNGGRGIVLLGHSQGSRMLARLIAEEIDGKPIAAKLVSAIIPGTVVNVPPGKLLGGTYRQTPLCEAATQIGCVIAYSTYPAAAKVAGEARFGTTKAPGMRYACVDPARVAGTKTLDPDLPVIHDLEDTYGTDFVALPGLLVAHCKDDGPASILAVAAVPETAAGQKAKALFDRLAPSDQATGLHPLDLNLALETLVDLVRKQTAVYLRR